MKNKTSLDKTDRLYGLDFLRGISALFIIFYHHKNFFEIKNFSVPFSNKLILIHWSGWVFVDLFFVISGFIFFYKYFETIKNKTITLKNFIVLRLSRLYPLVLITLIFTAILQSISYYNFEDFFIYKNNDLLSFILNLLFLQSGFFNTGYSFNGPSWSLGIEFWLYLVFFIYATKFDKSILKLILIVLFSFSIFYNYFPYNGALFFGAEFLRGIGSFYLGGLTYYIFSSLQNKSKKNVKIFLFFSITLCSIIYLFISLKLANQGNQLYANLIKNEVLLLMLIVHPLLCLIFSLSNKISRITSFKIPRLLGDISFSIYMWHVPLQILTILLIKLNILTNIEISSPFFLISFLILVVVISILSLNYLEKPLQKYIRDLYIKL